MTGAGNADAILADAAGQLVIAGANRYYAEAEWPAALTLFDLVIARHPTIADAHAVPLAIAHCRIELADAAALATMPPPSVVATGNDAEKARVVRMRHRAVNRCAAGDFARASRLLELIGAVDAPIGETYRIAIAPGPTACAHLAVSGTEPGFVAACGVSEPMIRAAKARFAGARVLLLTHHYSTTRGYEIANNLVRSASQFGLEVREAPVLLAGTAGADHYGAELLQHIIDFKPALVLFEEFVLKGFSAELDGLADQLRTVLAAARSSLGVRVARCDADAWYADAFAPDQLYAGLGDYLDLVQHHHAAILGGVPAERAASVFCCPFPTLLPATDGPTGTIPRVCFVGSIHGAGISRLVWWAESGARGLPIDFRVSTQTRAEQLSDLDYVRLLGSYRFALNFTRRGSGVRTLTARTIEVPLCGSVLLEEQSADTPYFLAPGVHYAPFETLDDLAAVTDGLLADDRRRQQMARDGQAWVSKYYAGDYFWTGILSRLWD